MLRFLHIENFAIMDDLEIEFKPGLNVLTGETGAGKSIIVDAISMLMGDRGSVHKVKSGHDKAVIEGLFELDGSVAELIEKLREMAVEPAAGELILRRDIIASGTGRCYINGRLTSSSALAGIREFLCDIHGQHQHQTLLRTSRQLDLLDDFADAYGTRVPMEKAYRERQELEREIDSLSRGSEERERRIADLKYAVDEINGADLDPEEEAQLDQEIEVMQHYHQLHSLFGRLIERLYEGEGSVIETLGQSLKDLEDAVRIDPGLAEEVDRARTCYFQLEDLTGRVRNYQGKLVFDPNRLERNLERREQIRKLKSKYGETIDQILIYREKIREELESIGGGDRRQGKLERRLSAVVEELNQHAQELTQIRTRGAAKLQREVTKGMAELGMEKARFRIQIDKLADGKIDGQGAERVVFLISTNPGETVKPLTEVVSGGELSRIMLALRSLQARMDPTNTLVFDEVDSGIGGQVAHAVAERLLEVARNRQVFVITHLPQIAARANHHMAVEKRTVGGKVKVFVRGLDGDGRVSEIIRMLGGDDRSDVSRRHAVELLEMSG
jgi:DNA repair protein RecN (Recombination protein N)